KCICSVTARKDFILNETEVGTLLQLDLNSHPNRDEDMLAEPTGLSMTSLVHSPSHQLEMYLKQNGFGNFVSRLVSTAGGESECRPPDDGRQAAFASEQQDKGDER
ncbi:unnamed protein product, partial [Ilex paraguariensis]